MPGDEESTLHIFSNRISTILNRHGGRKISRLAAAEIARYSLKVMKESAGTVDTARVYRAIVEIDKGPSSPFTGM